MPYDASKRREAFTLQRYWLLSMKDRKYSIVVLVHVGQRFSNFFQVGTTFISQNVLRTTLLLGLLNSLGLP